MSRQIPVALVDELAPGQRKLLFVEGRSLVMFNIGGELVAIDNSCPHNGAALSSGQLEGSVLRCPAHGLRFDLLAGDQPDGGKLCVHTFPVHTTGDKVMLVLETP
ncbi:nitrite reductase small subunit [Caballeronia choica]|uniref:Nitrite reductase small subunit n=1 Tax=Caballeronia choica TaxID=326476 RepID=A0A158KVL1_9BURK|nr:Rieske 2Fe-2S domain-containing protein [Caballeronia choica]SAL85198.1 nitrite reductase small subunit [Caballeronia choica]